MTRTYSPNTHTPNRRKVFLWLVITVKVLTIGVLSAASTFPPLTLLCAMYPVLLILGLGADYRSIPPTSSPQNPQSECGLEQSAQLVEKSNLASTTPIFVNS